MVWRCRMSMADRRDNPVPYELEPLAPREAVELYMDHREPELSKKTLQNHRYRLESFVEWCDQEEIDNLNELSGRDLHRYRVWRGRDVNTVTLRGQLATLRVFLEFCADIDGVTPGLRERVKLPNVTANEEARDRLLDDDRAEALLEYLETYRRASREHVIIAVLWHTGIRLGSLRAVDLDDYDNDPEEASLWIRHRPDTGTPLKNGHAAERPISLDEKYAEVIDDYIRLHRPDVEDDHGRRPLIASDRGRLSEGQIRADVYQVTQPCVVGECPHDREKESCEYRTYGRYSECPSSLSPHSIRRGSLTYQLRRGVPEEIVSDRCNVSRDVLDQHYDRRTDREKMEQRREFLDKLDL